MEGSFKIQNGLLFLGPLCLLNKQSRTAKSLSQSLELGEQLLIPRHLCVCVYTHHILHNATLSLGLGVILWKDRYDNIT